MSVDAISQEWKEGGEDTHSAINEISVMKLAFLLRDSRRWLVLGVSAL